MKYLFFGKSQIALLFLAVLVSMGFGCGSDGGEKTVTVTEIQTNQSATSTSPASPEPKNFSGTGPQATQKFSLKSGLVIFRFQYDGNGFFGAALMNDQGELVTDIGTATKPVDGSKAIRIPKDGYYIINISVSGGNWTISYEQE